MIAVLEKLHKLILAVFYKYGVFLGKHPFWFLVVPIILSGALAYGIFRIRMETSLDALYSPKESRALRDQQNLSFRYHHGNGYYLNYTSYRRLDDCISVIVKSRESKAIFDDEVLADLKTLISTIKAISVDGYYRNVTYEEICETTYFAECFVEGEILASTDFKQALNLGHVTYPFWQYESHTLDMRRLVSDVNVTPEGILTSAGVIQLKFWLNWEDSAWASEFLSVMGNYKSSTFEIAYSLSDSLNDEIERSTMADIFLFAMTFVLMIGYTTLASSAVLELNGPGQALRKDLQIVPKAYNQLSWSRPNNRNNPHNWEIMTVSRQFPIKQIRLHHGGDCVSTRVLLAIGGLVSVVLGVAAALGTCAFFGVDFIQIAGVVPFLTFGIGVDDMFLLMSSWSETLHLTHLSIPERIGTTFRSAGVGITITSVTDFVALMFGYTSQFLSVQNFCIYAGVGVLFCYLCNVTIFGACLTLHTRRVYSGRHTLTCRRALRDDQHTSGTCSCHTLLCTGRIPDHPSQEQSLCERGPKGALLRFLLWTPTRIVVLVIFAVYLCVSAWGCTKLKEGLDFIDLVMESTYFYKYTKWDDEYFGFKIPAALVTIEQKNYLDPQVLQDTRDLFAKLQEDPIVDPYIQDCWLLSFADSPFFDNSSKLAFGLGLNAFLRANLNFYSDIDVDMQDMEIYTSRCYAVSKKLIGSEDQKHFMLWTREAADTSPLGDVIAYNFWFVVFEQFVVILRGTLQTVGLTLLVMFAVTALFLPHPTIVAIVMLQIVMVLLGVFGFMALWGISLNAVTMIILIMSNGFSVDFCLYDIKEGIEKGAEFGRHSSRIGANIERRISSLLGVFVLYFSESYPFRTFFKMMVLVIGFGVLHAILFIPVVLSFIGPKTRSKVDLDDSITVNPEMVPEAEEPNTVESVGMQESPSQDRRREDEEGNENNVDFRQY